MDLPTDRRPLLLAAVAVLVVLLVAAFLWFRPDALFTDRVVDDELDAGVAAALATSPTPGPPAADPTPSVAPSDPMSSTPTPTPVPSSPAPAPDPEAAAPAAAAVPEPSPARSAVGTPEPGDGPTGDVDEPGPTVLARGEWISLEHETTGTVALLDDGGGLQVVLTDLATSNGPDLRVILSPKAAVPGDWYGYDDGATSLGKLRGNVGTQVYDVPDDLDPDDVASVVIWCERFSVGFGVADLA